MIGLGIKYAQIIVNNRANQVDKPFTYIVEGTLVDMVKEGMRVVIPFGRGNKLIQGIVIGFVDSYDQKYELKKVVDVIDDKPLISKRLIDLSIWMKEFYLSSYLDAFQPVFPPGDIKEVNTFVEVLDSKNLTDLTEIESKVFLYLKSKRKYC